MAAEEKLGDGFDFVRRAFFDDGEEEGAAAFEIGQLDMVPISVGGCRVKPENAAKCRVIDLEVTVVWVGGDRNVALLPVVGECDLRIRHEWSEERWSLAEEFAAWFIIKRAYT